MSILNNVSDNYRAKTLAGLMLTQMALGILLNFHFLSPILRYDGSMATQEVIFILGFATLLALLISSLNLVFGLLLPKDRVKQQQSTFIALVVFAGVGIALCATEYAQLSKYVAFLTSTYSFDAGANDATLEHFKTMLATGRNEAHFISIFVSSLSLLFFYGLLWRAAMLPSYLAGFALLAVLLQLVAVGHTFFELSIPMLMQLPLVITQLVVPIYLMVFGFRTVEPQCTKPTQQFS